MGEGTDRTLSVVGQDVTVDMGNADLLAGQSVTFTYGSGVAYAVGTPRVTSPQAYNATGQNFYIFTTDGNLNTDRDGDGETSVQEDRGQGVFNILIGAAVAEKTKKNWKRKKRKKKLE